MRALEIKVKGRVQGVFFRASTRDKALELGIKGWCQNEPDGSVSIHAEGDEQVLSQFLAWCHQGPRMAKVELLEKKEVSLSGMSGFGIRR